MYRKLSATLPFLLILLAFTVFLPESRGAVLSGWGTATIDGVVNPSEWASAATIPFSYGAGAYVGTVYMMNDATNLYVGMTVNDTALGPTDSMTLIFDNDNGGESSLEIGDDILTINGLPIFIDGFWSVVPLPDAGSGGTNDGTGAASRVDPLNHFEISHPLDSVDNAHDFSLSPGQLVGFNFVVFVNGAGALITNPSTWVNDYRVASAPPEGYHPVGGYMMPTNKLAILAPYLILACVFGAATLVFVRRKH